MLLRFFSECFSEQSLKNSGHTKFSGFCTPKFSEPQTILVNVLFDDSQIINDKDTFFRVSPIFQ